MAAKRLQIGCDWLQIDCKTAALRLQLQLKCSHVAAMGLQYLQNDFIDFIVWLRCGCMVCKMTSLLGCVVAAKSANWLHCYNEANLQRYCSDIAAVCSDFAAILQPNRSFAAAQQDAAKLHTMQPLCSRWFSKFAGSLRVESQGQKTGPMVIKKEKITETVYIHYKFNQILI